jgi:hypothetical protein
MYFFNIAIRHQAFYNCATNLENHMKARIILSLLGLCAFAQFTTAALWIYEGFDYTEGALLRQSGWVQVGSSVNNTITNGSLEVGGLAVPTGRSVWLQDNAPNTINYTYTNISAATGQADYDLYASFAFRIDTQLSEGYSNIFGMRVSDYNVVALRRNATDPYRFDIGLARRWASSPLQDVWSTGAGGTGYATGTVHFVVASINLDGTAQNQASALSLWINPSALDFGAVTPPAYSLQTNARLDATIDRVQLYRNMGVNSAFADELRVGTTWADVTPPVPEPALLMGLLALLPLLRRR